MKDLIRKILKESEDEFGWAEEHTKLIYPDGKTVYTILLSKVSEETLDKVLDFTQEWYGGYGVPNHIKKFIKSNLHSPELYIQLRYKEDSYGEKQPTYAFGSKEIYAKNAGHPFGDTEIIDLRFK